MLSDHQLNIPNLYNIPTGNVKKLVTNVLIKKIMFFIMKNLKLYVKLYLML